MDAMLTTLAPPSMLLAASLSRHPMVRRIGPTRFKVDRGGERVRFPLVPTTREVGTGVVHEHVECVECVECVEQPVD